MRISRFAVMACLSLLASPMAMAASGGIPAGNYVGHGDGSVVVFHVFPGGKMASIAPVEAGPRHSERPFTPKDVVNATHGAWKGKLKEVSPGHYEFVLGTPKHRIMYCVHSITVTPKGLLLRQEHGPQLGCATYHGASWSYSSPIHSPLRPYKAKG